MLNKQEKGGEMLNKQEKEVPPKKEKECSKCLNHGNRVPMKGHSKELCRHEICYCPKCNHVALRRAKMKTDIRKRRDISLCAETYFGKIRILEEYLLTKSSSASVATSNKKEQTEQLLDEGFIERLEEVGFDFLNYAKEKKKKEEKAKEEFIPDPILQEVTQIEDTLICSEFILQEFHFTCTEQVTVLVYILLIHYLVTYKDIEECVNHVRIF